MASWLSFLNGGLQLNALRLESKVHVTTEASLRFCFTNPVQ